MDNDEQADKHWILLLLHLYLHSLQLEEINIISVLRLHVNEQRRLNRALPIECKRPTWDAFLSRTNDRQFQRMFRMETRVFNLLCIKVEAAVGPDVFKSDCNLRREINTKTHKASEHHGGALCGEIKLALMLRLLAGSSCLDLNSIFYIASSSTHSAFHLAAQWTKKTFQFPLVKWLRDEDWDKLHEISREFAEKTDGMLHGVMSPVDGLAVRSKCPVHPSMSDPGSYFCRKGFYCLNVQACCDHAKRFLWVAPFNKGATHDSVAFSDSSLCDLLLQKADKLLLEKLFMIGKLSC